MVVRVIMKSQIKTHHSVYSRLLTSNARYNENVKNIWKTDSGRMASSLFKEVRWLLAISTFQKTYLNKEVESKMHSSSASTRYRNWHIYHLAANAACGSVLGPSSQCVWAFPLALYWIHDKIITKYKKVCLSKVSWARSVLTNQLKDAQKLLIDADTQEVAKCNVSPYKHKISQYQIIGQ